MEQIATKHVKAAIARARRIAVRASGHDVPVDLVELARSLGVQSVEPREMNDDGYIGRRPDGRLVVRYRAANCRERNRFTIAHELGHLLLADAMGRDVMDRMHRKGFDLEERAANRIAAELLMPTDAILRAAARLRAGWDSFFALRATFEVSTTAMIQRLLEVPGIATLAIRVALSSHTPSHRNVRCCQTSSDPALYFPIPTSQAICDLVERTQRQMLATIEMATDGALIPVECAGREVTGIGNPEYWIIGWRVLS